MHRKNSILNLLGKDGEYHTKRFELSIVLYYLNQNGIKCRPKNIIIICFVLVIIFFYLCRN